MSELYWDNYVYKIKKPLKIKRLTTVIVHPIELFSKQTLEFLNSLPMLMEQIL